MTVTKASRSSSALAHGQPTLACRRWAVCSPPGCCRILKPHDCATVLHGGALPLSWLRETGVAPVNWRAMETEELGSVYESLLELQPQLGEDGKTLVFASESAEQKGNQRKTTGSYYTPDSLVQALLDTALDPVLEKTEAESVDPVASLLKLTVIDPACGSGHFSWPRRAVSPRESRASAPKAPRRSLIFGTRCAMWRRNCIHGVDRNPMAVE